MQKLEKLVSLCNGEVSVTFNEHRTSYRNVDALFCGPPAGNPRDDVSPDVLAEMIRRDHVVCVLFHPHTPIGFHVVYHYDVDAALDEALAIMAAYEVV